MGGSFYSNGGVNHWWTICRWHEDGQFVTLDSWTQWNGLILLDLILHETVAITMDTLARSVPGYLRKWPKNHWKKSKIPKSKRRLDDLPGRFCLKIERRTRCTNSFNLKKLGKCLNFDLGHFVVFRAQNELTELVNSNFFTVRARFTVDDDLCDKLSTLSPPFFTRTHPT